MSKISIKNMDLHYGERIRSQHLSDHPDVVNLHC